MGQLPNFTDNTSGMGAESKIPPEIRGWSWGAFFLNWIWGIGNSVFTALWCLVPIVNIVMIFVLGAKGREWAWRNRRWGSVEEFKRVQRKWAIAGLAIWILFGIGLPAAFHFMFAGQKELALKMIRQEPELLEMLGSPVKTGWFVMGTIHSDLSGSCAITSVPVSGSKASGYLKMASIGKGESWLVLQATLTIDNAKPLVLTHNELDQYKAKLEPCMK